MADYGDILLQSIQTVVEGRISQLAFDKTIVCTIENNSNADKGEYTVSDGSTTFLAYSENTTYSVGISVYVNIPNGDFTKQKTITGKYMSSINDYYTYKSPWTNFVDITGDFYLDLGEQSLRANNNILDKDFDGGTQEIVILREYKINDGKEYSCIGLKADFKALLSNLGAETGTYGIRLYIRTVNKNGTSNGNPYKTYLAELSTLDMIGNPYHFESYYNQQKVFDISGMGELYSITMTIFQKNNFYDGNNQLIARGVRDNIFINNIYLALGYSIEEFDGNSVVLYSLDSDIYGIQYGRNGDVNKKTLKVRWIHEDDNGTITSVTDVGEMGRIHWYQYKLEQDVADDLAGAFWEEIPEWQDTFEQEINCYDYTDKQEIKYKVIVETPVEEYLLRDAATDPDVGTAISNLEEAQRILDNAQKYYDFNATDANKVELDNAQENYDSVLDKYNTITELYTAEVELIESEILTFTNEEEVVDLSLLDLIQGLSLSVDEDGYKGIYILYDETGNLKNSAEANILRTINANYKSTVTGDTDLDSAESIMWRFPLINTMIVAPEVNKEYDEDDQVETSEDGQYFIITRAGTAATGSIGAAYENATSQYFRIKKYYTPNATNNTITCLVTKDNKVYSASTELTFAPQGTNGTDFTFLLDMESDRTCLYAGDTNPLRINASLYDYNNDLVEHAQSADVTYSWYSKDDITKVGFCSEAGYLYDNSGNLITTEDLTNKTLLSKLKISADNQDTHLSCYIRKLTEQEIKTLNGLSSAANYTIPYYYILQASIEINATSTTRALGDVTLKTYLPIAYSTSYNYTQIEGANKIVYNSLGTSPNYYKDNYVLYQVDLPVDCIWDEYSDASSLEEMRYYPSIDDNGKLTPLSTFVASSNVNRFAAVAYSNDNTRSVVYWVQPVMIYQDTYSSNMLNAWDGSLTIDEESGTIMSTMLGAGYKDTENRFNGVLMGDVKSALADSSVSTGLFGYNAGAQSFGFKTDGTAFIGKAGTGQIKFDGNKGSIQSQSYSSGNTGMYIDLDDGYLEMRGGALSKILYKKSVNAITINDFASDLTNIYLMIGKNKVNSTSKIKEYITFLQSISSIAFNNLTQAQKATAEEALRYLSSKATDIVFNELDASETNQILMEKDRNKYDPVYSTTNSYIRLATKTPYFWMKDHNSETLIYAGDDVYYLQSSGFQDPNKNNENDQESGSGGQGIKFDLASGKLTGYNFSFKTAMSTYSQLDPTAATYNGSYVSIGSAGTSTDPFFRINYQTTSMSSGIYLINIERSKFVLHSQNWVSNTSGMEFDLVAGTLKAYSGFTLKATSSTGSSILLSSSSPYFIIKNSSGTALMDVEDNVFYLQTSDYVSGSAGIKLDLINSSLNAYGSFKLYTETADKSSIKLETTNSTSFAFTIVKKGNTSYPLLNITNSSFIMYSSNWSTTRGSEAGTQFNMDTGRISSYNFNIKAYKTGDTNKYIQINSNASTYPLQVIGSHNFKVSWDGVITAENITASTGQIGPFHITSSTMYTNSSEYGGSGIYFGSDGKASFNGTTSINGSASIGGTLTVGANTTISGSLTVTGDISAKNATFTGNISANNFTNNATGGNGSTSGSGTIGGISYGSGGLSCGSTSLSSTGTLTVGAIKIDGSTNTKKIDIGGFSLETNNNGILVASGSIESGSSIVAETMMGTNGYLEAKGDITAGGNFVSTSNSSTLITFLDESGYKNTVTITGNVYNSKSIENTKTLGKLAFADEVKKNISITDSDTLILRVKGSYSGGSNSSVHYTTGTYYGNGDDYQLIYAYTLTAGGAIYFSTSKPSSYNAYSPIIFYSTSSGESISIDKKIGINISYTGKYSNVTFEPSSTSSNSYENIDDDRTSSNFTINDTYSSYGTANATFNLT